MSMASLIASIRTPALAVMALLLGSAAAYATDLALRGGSGGNAFRSECPAGQFLVGMSIKAGAWVDAVAPLCAPLIDNNTRFGKWKRGARQGGKGGSPLLKDGACPSDRYIVAIAVEVVDDKYVDFIDINCIPLDGRDAATLVCLKTGEPCYFAGYNLPTCSTNEAATGIWGRAGQFVDALGLICGPRPLPVVASPAPAPQAPPPVADPSAPPADIVKDPTAKRANFSGTWNSVAGKDATKYVLDLGQQGTLVKGSYQPGDGRISGRVDGNKLIFNWAQAGSPGGTGRFEMLDPENKTFRGEYFVKGVLGPPSYWGGARQ
jgi:hypothetical protein